MSRVFQWYITHKLPYRSPAKWMNVQQQLRVSLLSPYCTGCTRQPPQGLSPSCIYVPLHHHCSTIALSLFQCCLNAVLGDQLVRKVLYTTKKAVAVILLSSHTGMWQKSQLCFCWLGNKANGASGQWVAIGVDFILLPVSLLNIHTCIENNECECFKCWFIHSWKRVFFTTPSETSCRKNNKKKSLNIKETRH